MSRFGTMRDQDFCESCGWPAFGGECRRKADTGDTCDLYAFSDVEISVECDGWDAPRVADLVSTRAPIALRPVPATVYRKEARSKRYSISTKGLGLPTWPLARIARYVPPVEPTWPAPWTSEELAAMGKAEQHSPEWQAWYDAMPAGMSAKAERDYFTRGPSK